MEGGRNHTHESIFLELIGGGSWAYGESGGPFISRENRKSTVAAPVSRGSRKGEVVKGPERSSPQKKKNKNTPRKKRDSSRGREGG